MFSRAMRSELLAFWGFSRKGSEFLVGLTVGGFACAVLLNLVRMTTAVRGVVLGLGVVAAAIFVSTRPYGEDRAAWAIIFGFALLAWFLGFASAGVVRALRRRH
jgi:peptidoglycan/LPS O-acetylase OafA/YrhL